MAFNPQGSLTLRPVLNRNRKDSHPGVESSCQANSPGARREGARRALRQLPEGSRGVTGPGGLCGQVEEGSRDGAPEKAGTPRMCLGFPGHPGGL